MKLFAVIGPAQQHLWEGRQADRGILWTCWWVKAWSDSFFGTACLMLPLVLSWEVRAGGVLCILDSSKSVYLHLWPCESAWVDQVGRLPSRISLRLGWVCHRGSCFGVGGLKYCLEQQKNKWQVLIFHCFSSPICTSIVDLARHQIQTWHQEEQSELIYLISALKTPRSISLLSSWKGLWHFSYCWIHCSC